MYLFIFQLYMYARAYVRIWTLRSWLSGLSLLKYLKSTNFW